MFQTNQWLNSTIKEKENELQELYMLQHERKEKEEGQAAQGRKGQAASLGVRKGNFRSLILGPSCR